MRPTRFIIGLGVVAVLTAGCGDDDADNQAADTKRYCELSRTLSEPPADIDPATATPEELTAAVKNHFAGNADNITELQRVAPASVAADLAVYVRAARQIADTGDLSTFDTPDNLPAIKRHGAFNEKECGIEPPGQ
jgi:hypothetical protein